MSKSIITLKNHFNGNDTIVVNIEGNIIVHNGCQTFKLSSLNYVCSKFVVPTHAKKEVLKAADRLFGQHKDLVGLVQISYRFLKYIKHQTHDICIAAIRNSDLAWAYVTIERSDEFHTKLVEQSPGQLRYIIDDQTPEMCMVAVQHNGYALCFVSEQTPEICIAAVQHNGYALQFVKEQTPEICLAAVKQNGFALRYVKEQTPELCTIAINYQWSNLFYVEEQTPELCMAAIEQEGKALMYVKEQTPEICLAAIKQNHEAEKFVTIDLE